MTEFRNARSVGAALRRAGIPTGYRYTQTGYTTHGGAKITEPGCEVTRQHKARYGGVEDYGKVMVFCIDPVTQEPSPAFMDRVEQALIAAELPFTRKVSNFEVPDPDPGKITVKRQFAVVLEDAFLLDHPSKADLDPFDGDVQAWAFDNMDKIYAQAQEANSGVHLMWEDQHKYDLDSPEDEIIVETP